MSKLTYKVSYYVLYALLAVIAIVLVLFYFGGSATGDDVIASIDPDHVEALHAELVRFAKFRYSQLESIANIKLA